MRSAVLLLSFVVAIGCDDKKSDSGGGDDKAKSGDDSLNAADEYKRKSMSGEARVMVKRMADAAKFVYLEERVDPQTGELVRGFPSGAPVTPAAGACCRQDKGKCAVYPESWQHPTWKMLNFEMSSPHYYSYEFVSKDDGFIARAIGDLDCDGTYSTFEVEGKVDGDEVKISELKIENEME